MNRGSFKIIDKIFIQLVLSIKTTDKLKLELIFSETILIIIKVHLDFDYFLSAKDVRPRKWLVYFGIALIFIQ